MKDVVIATIGTSILNNQRDIKDSVASGKSYEMMSEEEILSIKTNILAFLKSKEMNDKVCGSELNSIYYLINKNEFSGNEVHLIVSDSLEGRLASEIIDELLRTKMGVSEVILEEVEDLNASEPYVFAKKGLRNLAGRIATIVKNNLGTVMIAPLGGFKAEIIVAALIGQIFDVPSYYLFEGSEEIVEILPLPVTLDRKLFINNMDVITKMYTEEMVEKKHIYSYFQKDPKLKNIVDEEKIEGASWCGLSPLGEAGYEKLTADSFSNLPKPSKKDPSEKIFMNSNREGHSNEVVQTPKFQKLKDKILEIPYVTQLVVTYYFSKNRGDMIRINKSSNEKVGRVLKLNYNDKVGMIEADIYLTENDDEEKVEAAIIDITKRLNRK